MMGFGQAVGLYFSNYANFQGRSRRAEYWWVFLAQLIFYFVMGFLFVALGGSFGADDGLPEMNGLSVFIAIIFGIIMLGLIVPNISLAVRRFHDLGQTGWLVLVFGILGLIPLIGSLTSLGQLIWFAFPGKAGANQFGPDPKNPVDTGVFD